MTTQIVIHLLPYEIDWFEWQMKQLKLGSYYLKEEDTVIIDATLDLNLTYWDKTFIPKQYFINKFNNIQKICDWSQNIFIIDEDNQCLGCNDKRRQSIRSSQADNILYLDSDVLFRPELLSYMIEVAKNIPNQYYIVSPQLPKMWDESWNELVNINYIEGPSSIPRYENTDAFQTISIIQSNLSVKPTNAFKFGGGWFNLFSTNLLKFIDIPDSLGPYGVDDTFIMVCCEQMRLKKMDVKQYVLEGMIVSENIKYKHNPYEGFVCSINRQMEFKENALKMFSPEIQNFIDRINE